MPSFIFQAAATLAIAATAFAPSVLGMPVNTQHLHDALHASLYSEFHAPGSSLVHQGTVEVRHVQPVHPVMRTLEKHDFHQRSISNNEIYQAAIRELDGRLSSAAETGASASHVEDVNNAYVRTCTAKVIADLEDINAYHRGVLQDAMSAFEEATQSPFGNNIDLIKVVENRKYAMSLETYSDEEILQRAEDECYSSFPQALSSRGLRT